MLQVLYFKLEALKFQDIGEDFRKDVERGQGVAEQAFNPGCDIKAICNALEPLIERLAPLLLKGER
jgi:hypothetical protein